MWSAKVVRRQTVDKSFAQKWQRAGEPKKPGPLHRITVVRVRQSRQCDSIPSNKSDRFGARWQGAEPGPRGYRRASTSKSGLYLKVNFAFFLPCAPGPRSRASLKFATRAFKQRPFHS